MLASEMADIQLNKTPGNGRHLQGLGQTYVGQLCLDIEELTAHILSGKIDLKVLDIGIFDSPAIVELRDLILSRYGEKERINISLSGIDLQECKKKDGINFIQGDLDYDDFLISLLISLGEKSQDLIFMNQVSYYIGDRLKVIKFILENILATGGEFHFNLIPKRFYVGSGFQHWQFMEALESLWKESEGFSFSKNIVNESGSTADSFVYHFKKDADNATIKMPYFSRYERDNNGYCTSIYNFRKTMPCLLY